MKDIEKICDETIDEYIDGIIKDETSIDFTTEIDNMAVGYFFHYIPQSRDPQGFNSIVREIVWRFKNDREGEYSKKQYQGVRKKVVDLFATTLGPLFINMDRSNLALVFVPCSSSANHANRWKKFAEELSEKTDMPNGYDHVKVVGESVPSHYGGGGCCEEKLDRKWLRGKHVIIIDDLLTSGFHMSRFKHKLEDYGAKTIMGLCLAKTLKEGETL